MTSLVDAEDRKRALRVFDHNVIVTAGAGTGKTALLVGRLVAALVKRHIEPGAVLALTFTDNAAAEMRERLLRVLRAAEPFVHGEEVEAASDRFTLEDANIGPEELPRVRELLERSEELQVQTFHGFCLKLLQQRARDLDAPPTLSIADTDKYRIRFDAAFSEFLEALPDDPLPPAMASFEAKDLRDLAFDLAATIPSEALRGERLQPDFEDLERRVLALRDRGSFGTAQFLKYMDWALRQVRALRDGRRISDDPWTKSRPAVGKRQAKKSLGDETGTLVADEIDRDSTAVHRELKNWLEADDEAVDCAVQFLTPFIESWRVHSLRSGIVAFDDLIIATRHVLRTNPVLRRKIGSTYQAILVDEFQDTDPLQYDILFLLASTLTDTVPDDPLTVDLRPCLFLVGDAKQSIYRFRGADLAAFARVQRLILDSGGITLDLRANFRSTPAVLDFVNHICARTIEEDLPYQAAFQAVAPQLEDASPRAPVEIWVPATEEASIEDAPTLSRRRSREAGWIVRWVFEQQRLGIPPGRQAILMRIVKDSGWVLRALRHAGIPYVLDGGRRFYDRYETQLATALCVSVARPWDPAPVLGVLRSAFVGATDAEIADHMQKQGATLNPLRAPEHPSSPVERGLAWLADLIRRTQELPTHRAIDLLLSLPEWPLVTGSGVEAAQAAANLERLAGKLREAEPRDLVEAASLLERRVLLQQEEEEGALYDSGAEIDAVRILSAHRSKGLEFDAVLIPDCAQGASRQSEKVTTRLFTADGRVLLSARIGKLHNSAATQVRLDSSPHREAEALRLLYVTATRARKRLTLLFAEDSDKIAKSGTWQHAIARVGGVILTPHLESRVPVRVLTQRTIEPETRPLSTSDTTHSLLDAARRGRALATASSSTPSRVPSAPMRPGSAALLGSELHEYMRLASLTAGCVDSELLHRCTTSVGHREPQQELVAMADRFHRSVLRKRIAIALEVLREVSVTWIDTDGRARFGVIDLAFREASGWTVVDYKTDDVSAAGIDAAAARHTAQVKGYTTALRQALRLDHTPCGLVWFARIDELFEVVATTFN